MESLRTADGIELIRVLAQRILQELIEAEATAHIGAEPGEHTETRTTMRNGHRAKLLTTQAGDLDLAILPQAQAERRRPWNRAPAMPGGRTVPFGELSTPRTPPPYSTDRLGPASDRDQTGGSPLPRQPRLGSPDHPAP
ncbi:transposase [Streptomyces sp. NPDC049887]|uniref:transposase n=1 Tax=Streptomyces sp. NPDC049887 TaxID=3155654 RepID=UPI00344930BB